MLDLFNFEPGNLAEFAQSSRDSEQGHLTIKVDIDSMKQRMASQPFARYLSEISFVSYHQKLEDEPESSRNPDWWFPPTEGEGNFPAFTHVGQSVVSAQMDQDNIGDLIISGKWAFAIFWA